MVNGRGLMGMGAGCVPGAVQGECMYGDMSIACNLIRECDSVTGNTHWEYEIPGGRSGNVNIEVRGRDGQVVGRTDAQGNFIPVTDPRYTVQPTNTNVGSNVQGALVQANATASREALARYPNNPTAQAIYIAQRVPQIMAEQQRTNSLRDGGSPFNSGLNQNSTTTSVTTPPTTTVNRNVNATPQTTVPTSTPQVVQETSFGDLLGDKWDAVSGYVQDRDNWMVLGVGGAALLGLLWMGSSGRAGRRY